MSILATLNAVKDALVPLANAFDQYHNRSLFIVDRANGTYIKITPNPYIRTAPTQMMDTLRNQGIRVERDSIQVQGISKKYTREDLTGRGKYYVVEGVEENGVVVGGKRFDRYPEIDLEESPSGWSILLKEKAGEI